MTKKKCKTSVAKPPNELLNMIFSEAMMEDGMIDDASAIQGIQTLSELAKSGEATALKLTELIIQQDSTACPNEAAIFA